MSNLRLGGVEVHTSGLSQRAYRATPCTIVVPVTADNQNAALKDFRRLYKAGGCQGLHVSGIKDLSFLNEFENLLYLEIDGGKRVNVKPLEELSNLRGLYVESPGCGLDFSCFPELEGFGGKWHVENENLDQARELRWLKLDSFNPASKDFADLAGIPRLERLKIVRSTVLSLVGIETLEDLRYAELFYMSKLKTVDAFTALSVDIRELAIENANAIDSYKPIASIPRLRRLRLSHCAAMPDLTWTKGMENLDFFSFVETNVEDGDLTPLTKLPKLRYVGTMNKRSYNYTCEKLHELFEQRERQE